MKNLTNTFNDFSIPDKMEKIKKIKILLSTVLPESETVTLINELEMLVLELDKQKKELIKGKEVVFKNLKKYADLYESAPIGYFTLNRLGQIQEINLQGSKMLGKSKSELLNYSFSTFITIEKLAIFQQFIDNAFSSQTQEICEVRILSDKNKTLNLYLSAIVSKNKNECLVAIVDISQRIKVEEEFRTSEVRYSNLFKNIQTGIVVHGPDTKVLLSNPRASELLGLNSEQMKGKDAIDSEWNFINENNEVLAVEDYPVNRVVREKMFLKNQILGICQPGTKDVIWVTVNGFTITNEMGEITEIIISLNDITEIKKYEKKLYELNQASEQHIIERTLQLEIANKKLEFENAEKEKRAAELVIANKELSFQNEEKVRRATELISANKDLESFSYSVSHDLRAPLRHIVGFTEMLSNEFTSQLSDTGLHYLKIIIDSARIMSEIIDGLINLSRTSRTEIRKEKVNMNQIIQDAINRLNITDDSHTVNWEISNLPTVIGDYNLLISVWANLLDNALKYSRMRDESIIQIDFEENDEETIIWVSDNGVGFDMKYANKLFGVFERLHSSSEFEGIGIGLANVKRIITKHGGRLWANAELNKGATFYFSLPKIKGGKHYERI